MTRVRLFGSVALAATLAAATPAAVAPANLIRGCVDRFDAAADYFPDKASLEDASNFAVEYHRSYKVVTVREPYPGGTARARRPRPMRRATTGADGRSRIGRGRDGADHVAVLGVLHARAAARRSRPPGRPHGRGQDRVHRQPAGAGARRLGARRRVLARQRHRRREDRRRAPVGADDVRVPEQRICRRFGRRRAGRGQRRVARAHGARPGRVGEVRGAVSERGAARPSRCSRG